MFLELNRDSTEYPEYTLHILVLTEHLQQFKIWVKFLDSIFFIDLNLFG